MQRSVGGCDAGCGSPRSSAEAGERRSRSVIPPRPGIFSIVRMGVAIDRVFLHFARRWESARRCEGTGSPFGQSSMVRNPTAQYEWARGPIVLRDARRPFSPGHRMKGPIRGPGMPTHRSQISRNSSHMNFRGKPHYRDHPLTSLRTGAATPARNRAGFLVGCRTCFEILRRSEPPPP